MTLPSLKRLLVGSPISSDLAHHERLTKRTALAVFSSDALSSVAYSTEAILLVLLAAGSIAIGYLVPIILGLAILLAILTLSYRQTIHAYPSGGGAYIVAKDNLGALPGLVAGASLLVDYILTVAVSISAGVAAITSAAQGTRFEWLHDHRVALCLFMIGLIAVVNLRGVRESGAIFAGPTYLFIIAMLLLVIVGFYKYATTGATLPTPDAESVYFDTSVGTVAHGGLVGTALVWLLLRAFAGGCTALTGVEAISNGVPAFKEPSSRNAATTLTWMAVVMTTLILGTGFLAFKLNAHPVGEHETLISVIARHTFGSGFAYYFIQASTAAILVLAANTSFADFPRLSSLLAADRYLPRQLANRGDRLVFSNGIIILALLASILVVVFQGEEQKMLPLYALGVFISFTLSQAGMVIHWLRERRADEAARRILDEERTLNPVNVDDPGRASHRNVRLTAIEQDRGGHWLLSILVNGAGALITCVVLLVIAVTKFMHGAWAVVILIPLIVWMFRSIHRHYVTIAEQLSLEGATVPVRLGHRVIVPVSGVHRGLLPALQYSISMGERGKVTAAYVETNPESTEAVLSAWDEWGMGVELHVLPSPYRSVVSTVLKHIKDVADANPGAYVTVVLPEFVPRAWWQQLLHNQTALLIKARLLFERNIVVTSVPHHLAR
ncbi:MAG TPA: APC family permease [Blastocatellia bacterium]|nr:APC family permease [Blastocatellia bacterium]